MEAIHKSKSIAICWSSNQYTMKDNTERGSLRKFVVDVNIEYYGFDNDHA